MTQPTEEEIVKKLEHYVSRVWQQHAPEFMLFIQEYLAVLPGLKVETGFIIRISMDSAPDDPNIHVTGDFSLEGLLELVTMMKREKDNKQVIEEVTHNDTPDDSFVTEKKH